MKLTELDYSHNVVRLFERIAHEPWSMLLDSGYPYIDSGRFDIIVGRPAVTLETRGMETRVTYQGEKQISTENPFTLLRHHLGEQETNLSGLPFCGGAVGYFAYDLGRRLEAMPALAKRDIEMPDMAVGIYDWSVIIDHHLRQAWLCSYRRFDTTNNCRDELESLFQKEIVTKLHDYQFISEVESNLPESGYNAAFDRIKHYIREGDCYQVNLAQRFSAGFQGNDWQLYKQLRQRNPAPYSAYLNLPCGSILSSSPERFIRVTDQQVEAKPIKGTVRRSVFAYEDKALAESLLESEKDRAENLMIVDLLRNDIGRNCRAGSVTVPRLFALETYASVHHLVSTVRGSLEEGRHALDLLRGCFPGGSITGAPKVRAMEIIEELEPHQRSVYCGAVGFIGFDGNMDTNIAIRTMIRCKDSVYCYAGGGIVWDSESDKEYRECFDKASAMLELFKPIPRDSAI